VSAGILFVCCAHIMVCNSGHKRRSTLPVLTHGSFLHRVPGCPVSAAAQAYPRAQHSQELKQAVEVKFQERAAAQALAEQRRSAAAREEMRIIAEELTEWMRKVSGALSRAVRSADALADPREGHRHHGTAVCARSPLVLPGST
jgi:hypothetical protein